MTLGGLKGFLGTFHGGLNGLIPGMFVGCFLEECDEFSEGKAAGDVI